MECQIQDNIMLQNLGHTKGKKTYLNLTVLKKNKNPMNLQH